MTHGNRKLDCHPRAIAVFNAGLERRRVVLTQVEAAIHSATKREQVLEQLERISEEVGFIHRLSGFSFSVQTAAAILNLIRENSRLYKLATRRLAEFEHASASWFRPASHSRRSSSSPSV
jgi:hypothetical protein